MHENTISRMGNALFGAFFLGLAVAILIFAWDSSPAGATSAGVVVGALGADGIFSAVRGRRSVLARLGPLP